MGLWEGLTRDEVVAGWPGEWDRWRTTSAHASPPEGESRWQVAQRANEVVAELDAGDGRPGADRLARRADRRAHRAACWRCRRTAGATLIGVGNCHWVILHRFAGAWRLHSYNAGLGGVVLPRGEDEVAGT